MKLLYLHDYKQNLNATRIDELKEQYEVVVPLVSDSDMENEERVRDIISDFSADYLADRFIAVGEGLGDQEFYPLLDLERVPRKEVVLNFDKQPLEIPSYLMGFLSGDELENKADPRYFCIMRAAQKFGQHIDTDHPELFEAAQIINKILDEEDPAKSTCSKETQLGKYDYLAVDIASDYLFSGHSIEASLIKNFKFHLNIKLSDSALKTLSKSISAALPAKLKAPSLSPKKDEKNELDNISAVQAKKLESINNKLIKLEKRVLNQALKIDKEHQKPVFMGLDPWMGNDPLHPPISLEKYEIYLKVFVHLKQQTNPLTAICEIPMGCSKNKSEFLRRLTRDHNEFSSSHPLSGFRHCWLFHQLYAVANISFKDLLQIENIDIDVTVDALPKY